MEKRYSQSEEENWFEYAERLIENRKSGVYDIDKAEVYELLTGETVSHDHARKMLCFLEKLLCKYNLVKNLTVSESEELKRLIDAKREVYKERQKLKDEKNEYNSWQRNDSRVELFYERIDEACNKLIARKNRIIPEQNIINNKTTELVVAFGDCHYDSHFVIKGLNGEILNEYSIEVFEKRMWELRDEIIDFANLHGVNKLRIIDAGDVNEGILRVGSLQSIKGNPMDAILDYTDFIEDWLNSLVVHGFVIDFYTSLGNHSELRILNNEIKLNLECMYNRILRKLFVNDRNITIHSNNEGLNHFNVLGYDFLTVHGQNERNLKDSIKDYEDTYNINVNYLLVGHKHSKYELEPAKGKETIQIRSVMGINEYSTKIKKSSEAGANMFTVHKGYGKKYVNEVKFY
jgi:hypothetical protein